MLPQPGQKLAFPAGHGGVLRQMGMAVDQARKNRDRTMIYPANAFGTVASPRGRRIRRPAAIFPFSTMMPPRLLPRRVPNSGASIKKPRRAKDVIQAVHEGRL